MRKAMLVASGAVAASLSLAIAVAQPQQVVTPPKAVYWVSADTVSGMMAMVSATRSQMMTGQLPKQARTLKLELGSTMAPASGPPAAAHDIPAGLQMGRTLDLKTPERAAPEPSTPTQPGAPPDPQQIRGRLKLFWGCGEHVGPGQPVVVDFAGLQRGQLPTGLNGATLNLTPERGPSEERSRTYGEWPHGDRLLRGNTSVPATGSLVGDHFVHGNYSPDIRFTLGADRDFLAPVQMTQTKNASSSVALSWAAIPNATGYFATVFGGRQGQESEGNDTVIWSSSARKLFFGPMGQYIAPADAARLVGEHVLLAPATTNCTVPVEVSQAAPQGAMLMFSAFGPEANFVYPPRPANPATPWNQEWTAKVRFKAGLMAALGASGDGMMAAAPGATPEQQAEMRRQQCEARRAQQGAVGAGIGSAIGGATGIPGAGAIGGMMGHAFGKAKQKNQPADPDCP